jgi:arsenate reductase
MIIEAVNESILRLIDRFDEIEGDRKKILRQFAESVSSKLEENKEVDLIFICTHNSRRSHMSQIWGQTAAEYYGVKTIRCFSGGTEVTQFNPTAARTVMQFGFEVQKTDESENPLYLVEFSEIEEPLKCFSKVYSDQFNPQNGFIAVMTCSHVEENCPVVFGSKERFSIQYDDPKIYDGTEYEEAKYSERFEQIGIEMLFTFMSIKNSNPNY